MSRDENPPFLVGYARVSTADQKLDLQIDALTRAGVDPGNIFTDQRSGGPNTKRPGVIDMLKQLHPGDVIVVWKLDRLGRSLSEMLQTLEYIEKRGARLRSLTEGLDSTTVMGRFGLQLLAAVAEMERGLIRERTMAGQASGRARGKNPGRPKAMSEAQEKRALKLLLAGKKPPEVAKLIGVGKSTIYGRIRDEWASELATIDGAEEPKPR